ncbi:MAG TPA: protease, partial [Tenuifilaceae bacterium]|nr:protease [Tenuifilaceae bacterium]
MKKVCSMMLLLGLLSVGLAGAQEARLMRFPAVHGNQVVFTYAGDLYTVPLNGGVARKLTSHIGYEMFARFSPDGKTIAFTGQYDGNTEVFTIPAEGGTPKRLTYTATLSRDDISDRMGPNNIVMTWTPDGKNIVYRSRKQSYNDFVGSLFMVPIDGGLSSELPLTGGGFCSYSPDGKQLAFNWVFREFRTWKYYKGGMADDIRIFDFDTKQITNITNTNTQEIFPMWIGGKIFFLSDRDRTMNLFCYDLKTQETKKVTNFTDYDIKFPSFSGNTIVFEKGGYLYSLDASSLAANKIDVTIADDQLYSRSELVDAGKSIRSMDLSPNGERVVFSARGDVFTLPAESGITRNLTQSSDAHDRNAAWSPDGKYIAYISDKSGEYEIYLQAQDGASAPVQLTTNTNNYIFNIEWSPDSKKILFTDRLSRLQCVDVETKAVSQLAKGKYGSIYSYSWSPDSKWVAYSTEDENRFSVVFLYNTETASTYNVTGNWYTSTNPVFSNDGLYLLFVSDRDFNPIYSSTEWNHAYTDMSKIFMVMLSKNTPSPFAPENNEVKIEPKPVTDAKKKNADDKKATEAQPTVKPVQIDIDGIVDRTVSLPIDAANYRVAACIDGMVYYSYYGSGRGSQVARVYDLKKKT